MSQSINVERRTICPACGNNGRRVRTVTLGTLLKDELADPFVASGQACGDADEDGCQSINSDTGWRFCESQDCDIVYFSDKGDTTFTKSQLKVAVGVKETEGERPLCYCFGHSIASIKNELQAKGRSDAVDDIRAKMKDPGCHCERENPSGSCCLGNVAKGIKIAEEELEMTDTSPQSRASTSQSSVSCAELIAKLGTVVSAIMASACCWLPLVLLAVGVSGAGIAATLETYRPVFIVVTVGFLAAAFYFTYRPRRTVESGQGCCPTETTASIDCCAASSKRRLSMLTMNKVMLWVVTVLALGFLFFPSYVGALLGTGDGAQVTESMNTTMFEIDGMTCEGCVSIAEKAIRNVPGVLAVEIDYMEGQAIVGTENCCSVPKDEIIEAIQQAGYEAQLSEPSQPLQNLSTDATVP